MKNFLSLRNTNKARTITSIAIGKFDGLHLAHQKLFESLHQNGIILCIESDMGELLPKQYRDFYTHFDIYHLSLLTIKHKNHHEFLCFLKEILPCLGRIVVGYDFRFGYNRLYDVLDLQQSFDGEVCILQEITYKQYSIHTEVIKELIIAGRLEEANALLGRIYEIRGPIIRGQGIGGRLLYATINLQNDGFVLPKEGVYAGYVQLGPQSHTSPKHRAVIFIGHRLSTDLSFAMEAHLLEMKQENIQHNCAGFYFYKRIRDNEHFSSLATLKDQIKQDITQAQNMLQQHKVRGLDG